MKSIAIIRLSALGDIVNSAFVLQFIKQNFPDIRITWVTEEVFAPLLQEHPLVDDTVTLNLKQLKKEKSFSLLKNTLQHLRSLGEFDNIIDMQGLLKSAVTARLIGSKTHGFDKDSIREPIASFFYKTTTHIPYEANVVLRNAQVISDALKITITKEMIEKKEPVFPVFDPPSLPTDKPNVACVIGASWESKRYPKEKLLTVLQNLSCHAHILWGNEAEYKDALFIEKHLSHASIAPKMSLPKLVSFIGKCDLVIGNDTGPTHMAWAQNIPSITLFGPTNERMIFETAINKAIHSASHVEIKKINKKDFSIREIDPQTIIQNAKELLLCKK